MNKRIVLSFALLSCVSGLSFAEGYRNPPLDTVALARSGAAYTRTGNVGVLAYTPAQILSLTNSQAQLNIAFASTDVEHTGPDGVVTKNKSDVYALPNLFANFPLSADLSLGLSLTTPYGQGTEYDRSSRFALAGPYRAQLTMVDLAPSIAWRAQDWFWLSAGLDLYGAALEFDQNVPWALFGAPAGTPAGTASVESDGEEVGFSLSAVLKPLDGHSLTATYRKGPSVDFSGDLKVSESPIPSPLSRVSDFETTIRFPNLVALGYGVELNDKVQVEVYVEFLEWSRNKSLIIDGGSNQALIPGPLVNNWEDTVTFGAGASWEVSSDLVLHTGYTFIESPVPDETLSPLLVDSDRHAFSGGCSLLRGSHQFDLAGTLTFADDRNIRTAVPGFLNGKYETTALLFGFSYTYKY